MKKKCDHIWKISLYIMIYTLFLSLGFIIGFMTATHYIVSTAIATMSVMDIHVNANIESNFTLNQTQLVEDMYRLRGEKDESYKTNP